MKDDLYYAVIYEPSETGWCAYVPDLPGCVSAGTTMLEIEHRIAEAVGLHLNLMKEDGDAIPPATSLVGTVRVPHALPELSHLPEAA